MEAVLRAMAEVDGRPTDNDRVASLPPDMQAMLRGATAGGGTNPFGLEPALLKEMGGLEGFQKEAANLWKHMDQLAASDPKGYQEFVNKQARAAGVALPGTAVDTHRAGAGSERPKTPGTVLPGAAAHAGDAGAHTKGATFLLCSKQQPPKREGKKKKGAGLSERDIVVALWRAGDATKLPRHPGGRFPAEMRERSPPVEVADVSSIGVPAPKVVVGTAAATRHLLYCLECNTEDVTRALSNPEFQGVLLESAFQHVEHTHKVVLERGPRKLYTLRDEVGPSHLQSTAARAAAAAITSDAGGGGSGVGRLSDGLLVDIASMAHGPEPCTGPLLASAGGGGGRAVAAPKPSKPLIQEVAAANSKPVPTYTITVAAPKAPGEPRMVVVVVNVPHLGSAAEADLEVSKQDLVLRSGAAFGTLKIPLPRVVETETVRAKFDKNKGFLTIKMNVAKD